MSQGKPKLNQVVNLKEQDLTKKNVTKLVSPMKVKLLNKIKEKALEHQLCLKSDEINSNS